MRSPHFDGLYRPFLVSAQAYGVDVVTNKTDLYDKESVLWKKDVLFMRRLATVVYPQALNDDLSDIKELMKGKVNVISDTSGKSTLLNSIQPNSNITTQEISEQHQQGNIPLHFHKMYDLDFGASIIDTSHVRGFGLIEMDKYELGDYFVEFFKQNQL